MRLIASIAATVALLSLTAPAHAESCNEIAANLAKAEGGKVISASASNGQCRVQLLIDTGNGPPVRRSFVVNM